MKEDQRHGPGLSCGKVEREMIPQKVGKESGAVAMMGLEQDRSGSWRYRGSSLETALEHVSQEDAPRVPPRGFRLCDDVTQREHRPTKNPTGLWLLNELSSLLQENTHEPQEGAAHCDSWAGTESLPRPPLAHLHVTFMPSQHVFM